MKKLVGGIAAFALPMFAFAQSSGQPTLTGIQTLIQTLGHFISLLLPIVVALALLGFFWGLAKFIFSAGDEGAKDEGRRIMIWGVVALFVMVSVWGLVQFIGQNLGINQTQNANVIPSVQGVN